MTTVPYMSRQWNDDDRNTKDYISYYTEECFEYVHVWKILKEMYDEDKCNLYIHDSYGHFAYSDPMVAFPNCDDYDYDYDYEYSDTGSSVSAENMCERQDIPDETESVGFTYNKFYYQ